MTPGERGYDRDRGIAETIECTDQPSRPMSVTRKREVLMEAASMTPRFRDLFALYLDDRAAWRSYLATRFVRDEFRNDRSAEQLVALAAYVRSLPDADPTLGRLAMFEHSNLGDQYFPGEYARYAIERYGFHEVTRPEEFLDDLVDLAVQDEADDVADAVPAVLRLVAWE
jgi:hypothetical protein